MPNSTAFHKSRLGLYFLLFTISGFSGLIYESIWSHYLKLFLGHAAYAQTLVLIIFMGGMALGAWLTGKYSHRIKRLLIGYALVEAVIGILGLVFHPFFVSVTGFIFDSVLPGMESIAAVTTVKWSLGALMILPQSILLGSTFPLMTAGVIRRYPEKPGKSIATLYFTNSLGAAIGVLVSGFYLIGKTGLPGTILTAGIINLLLAAIVAGISTDKPPALEQETAKRKTASEDNRTFLFRFFLLAAGLTGMASFIYEIGWIRMLSLVLGSSTHSFELILSGFIFGLAIGGFWIRFRIDRLQNPIRTLGIVQIVMGLLAVFTLFLYGNMFELMEFIMTTVQRTESGYTIFNLSSHAIGMLIMIPPTVCAGMTLPLLTYFLLKSGHGEGAIGKVYGANTLGSILGVIAAVHILMPLVGLKNLILAGGLIDMLLGLALLRFLKSDMPAMRQNILAGVVGLATILVLFVVRLDPVEMGSGVYRHGRINRDKEVVFHKDGKTSTIDVFRTENSLSLTTNGKPDASLGNSDLITDDEITQVLISALPMTVYRKAEKTALIGLGCGKSAHTLLHDPTVGRLDVIEIEPAIVEASKLFGDRVKNVHTDPRCHIYVEDAKTFFSSRNEQYDLIISQPSNPWVSGVASLFTSEFYAHITRYLAEDGIFAQWMQIYEVDATLLATVVKALAPNFSDYNLYLTVDGDLLILATRHGRISYNGRDLFDIPDMNAELSRLGILNMQDILIRKVSSKSLIEPYFLSFDIAANSDYEPVLDLNAVKARFLQYKTPELLLSRVSLIPMLPFLDPNPPFPQPDFHQQLEISSLNYNAHQGLAILQKFQEMIFEEYKAGYAPDELSATVMNGVLAIYGECDSAFLANIWPVHFRNLMYLTLPYFGPQEMELIWAVIESANCYSQLPEYNRALVQLFKRLARRDVEGVLTDENFQLPEDWILPSERNDHLLALHMLGWLAADSPGNSLELWRRYGGKDSTTLELNMLHQMSLRRQEAEQAFEEGNEQFEKEEWQAAIKDYDRTIFLHPGHWRAYNNRGACQYKLGNKAAAIDDYSFAAMTNPGSGMIWLNLGKVKLETGNIEGACGDLTRALQLGQKEAEKDLVEHCQLPAAPSPAP